MGVQERVKGLAAKIESSYNTDPTIAEATDSIQTSELEIVPLDGEFVQRNLDGGSLGERGDIIVASRALANFNVECAGAGAAGGIPEYDQLLRACGFAATNTALVDTQYDPISTAFDSIWFEANANGIKHVGGGARGTLSIAMASRGIPQMAFSMQGLYVAPTDVPIPTYTLTNFQIPEAFNNENTTTMTLHGIAAEVESFNIDLQNVIEHIDVPNYERIELVQRAVRGQITFQRPLIAVKDWFATARAATVGALVIQHGDTAGNIFQIDAPVVQLINPRYSESRGILMLTMDLILRTSSGNDELKLTIK